MQPSLEQDYYELFGLPPGYAVDSQFLAQRYRELQQSIHPDRFARASDQERRLSMQWAAHINEAYQTLKHPLRRARYLLERQGIAAEQQAASLDNAFLMQQMELREQLEQLPAQPDPVAALMALRRELDQQLQALMDEFARLFGQADTAGYARAHEVFNKMQFLHKLQQEIDVIEEQIQG